MYNLTPSSKDTFITCLFILFQSQTLVENDQDLKIEVLSVLQHFSKHSGKKYTVIPSSTKAVLEICSKNNVILLLFIHACINVPKMSSCNLFTVISSKLWPDVASRWRTPDLFASHGSGPHRTITVPVCGYFVESLGERGHLSGRPATEQYKLNKVRKHV